MSDPTHRPVRTGDVREGRLLGVLVAGEQVVVTRIDGQLYAVDGVCPHQYVDLDNAHFRGDVIVCHFHGSEFDARTGALRCGPATESLRSYAVSVEDDHLLVDGRPALVRVGRTGLLDRG